MFLIFATWSWGVPLSYSIIKPSFYYGVIPHSILINQYALLLWWRRNVKLCKYRGLESPRTERNPWLDVMAQGHQTIIGTYLPEVIDLPIDERLVLALDVIDVFDVAGVQVLLHHEAQETVIRGVSCEKQFRKGIQRLENVHWGGIKIIRTEGSL